MGTYLFGGSCSKVHSNAVYSFVNILNIFKLMCRVILLQRRTEKS